MYPKHVVTLLVLLVVMLPPSSARAGGVVTICDEAHLRAALAGGGTVTFGCSGTIILASQIVIASDTTLDGTGQNVAISGNGAVRVFTVDANVTLNLRKLTITRGSAINGGGIYNDGGTVIVNVSIFASNRSSPQYTPGGAIYNDSGTVIVDNSTFISNIGSYSAGGIYSYHGTVTVIDSSFNFNYAGSGGGGAIRNDDGALTITGSTFSDNEAHGDSFGGGAVLSGGLTSTLAVSNSTFLNNQATYGGDGGAIWVRRGTATLNNSTFSGNTAGLFSNGGAIEFSGGSLTISNSSFFHNGSDYGGGIDSWVGTLRVYNCTFSDNWSGVDGGTIHNYYGTSILKNTIVANPRYGKNCYGTITDGGGNLSFPDTTCPGVNADPKLGPLQDNGGPTQTMALLPGSAALDAGNDVSCATFPVNNLDQRGVTRPQGAHCDIGAYEAVQSTPPTPTATPTPTNTPTPTPTNTPTTTPTPGSTTHTVLLPVITR